MNIFDGVTWQTVSVNRPPRGQEGVKLWAQCLAAAVGAKLDVKRAWGWVEVEAHDRPEDGKVRLNVTYLAGQRRRSPWPPPRQSWPSFGPPWQSF